VHCYSLAETITPRGTEEGEDPPFHDYHPGKAPSDVMVQIGLDNGGVGYIPFVWLIIDPADPDSLGGLDEC
jgi:hypothetical protein